MRTPVFWSCGLRMQQGSGTADFQRQGSRLKAKTAVYFTGVTMDREDAHCGSSRVQ